MNEHRKQRVTVGDLLAVRAMDIPSIVDPRRVIDESYRQLVDCRDWDSDRHAVSDARLLSDGELLADDLELAKPADPHLTETLDLSGPGVEDLGGES